MSEQSAEGSVMWSQAAKMAEVSRTAGFRRSVVDHRDGAEGGRVGRY